MNTSDDFLIASKEDCALFDIHRLSRVMTSIYNGYLRESGLTMRQLTILRITDSLCPVDLTRLAEAMMMERTSMTRLISPLISRGLMETRVGEDKRCRNVVITEAGVKLIAECEASRSKAQQAMAKRLGHETWNNMREGLREALQELATTSR